MSNPDQIADERLYLTADKKKLVGEGSKDAAFLYAGKGDIIPASAAEKFGLKDGRLPSRKAVKKPAPTPTPTPAAKGGAKSKPATQDKSKPAGEDKSGGASK